MKKIWIATCEILVKPGDLRSGRTKAFVNITTWADSVETVTKRVSAYLETRNWYLIGIENVHAADENRSYGEELLDMIEKIQENPASIMLGRFFTYKED
jgi:hypothetical protein